MTPRNRAVQASPGSLFSREAGGTSAVTSSLEHIGEWKVEIAADSLEEIFEEVARFIAASNGVTSHGPVKWEPVVVVARDTPTLLVDWANELLGRSEANDRAYASVRNLLIDEHPNEMRLTAEVSGLPVHIWSSPLKAATYHSMQIEQRGRRWYAVVLLDV